MIEGKGAVEDLATGESHTLAPGTVYALNEHDRHVVRVEEAMRLVCVFNPPLVGPESHNADGAYPVLDA